MPRRFTTVPTVLIDLCKTLDSSCIIHLEYPGIEWTNEKDEIRVKTEQQKKASMRDK